MTALPAYQRAAVMKIVELKRSGSGQLQEGLTKFVWTGPSHSAMQGTLDLELQSKTVRKEIPGGNEVVEQVMAATWQPFDINGEWDDKWAGPGFAMGMYNDFAIFAQKTPLVRFTLDKNSIQGLITKFSVKYKVESKIMWSMTISPHVNETFTEQSKNTEIDLTKKSLDQRFLDFGIQSQNIQDLRDQRSEIPLTTFVQPAASLDRGFGIPTSTPGGIGVFDLVMADINDAITDIGNASTNILQTDTAREFLKAASLFRRVRGAALAALFNFKQACNAVDVAKNDVLGALNYDAWLGQAHQQIVQIAGDARDGELDMERRLNLGVAATVYSPKANESLERISQKFYGTPDNAGVIYDANHLSSTVLIGTEKLLIPNLSNAV
jgi:hypothetical protein